MNGSNWRKRAATALSTGVACGMLTLAGARPAHAVRDHLTSFEETYPPVVGSRIDGCHLCHEGDSFDRNEYGMAYELAGDRFAPIESADADLDGFSNLDEILALTFPGNPGDRPAAVATQTPTATPLPTATRPAGGACAADCNGEGTVAIDELVKAVNIALGSADLGTCTAADRNGNGMVTIDELLAAVNAALGGC